MLDLPKIQAFNVYKNADFQFNFAWGTTGPCDDPNKPIPVNLDSYMAKMVISDAYPPTETYFTAYSANYSEANNAYLTFPDRSNGQVQLLIPIAVLQTWTFTAGIYDLILISPTGTQYLMFRGQVFVFDGIA